MPTKTTSKTPADKAANQPIFDSERGLIYYTLSSAFTVVLDATEEGIELNNSQRAALAGMIFNEMRNVAQVSAYEALAGNVATWTDVKEEAEVLRKMWKDDGDDVISKLDSVIGFSIGENATFEKIFDENEDKVADLEVGEKVKTHVKVKTVKIEDDTKGADNEEPKDTEAGK